MSVISPYLQQSFQGLGNLHELHRSMQTKASLERAFSFLMRRSRNLLDLNTTISTRKIRSQYDAGVRTVRINRIKGSEGRIDDFDRGFHPMRNSTKERWVSVATARSNGVTLPAVELIQLGEDYFVRDGHHRISVARALGEEYIDAKVTVLELEPVPSPLPGSL